MKKTNIYLEVLKYGAENLSRGITYNDAVKYLGYNAPGGDFELYFNNWFYDNFHSENVPVLKKKQNENVILTKEDLSEANGHVVFLTSNAYFKYMTYSADNMPKETMISLIFASVSLVISIAIYLFILIRL
jgi:hypothetical protein